VVISSQGDGHPAGVELVRAALGGWGLNIGPNPDLTLIVTLTARELAASEPAREA
jgi:hypothetical protein